VQVGDIVKYDTHTQKWALGLNLYGLIVETGVYVGGNNVKVRWFHGETTTQRTSRLEVVSESR